MYFASKLLNASLPDQDPESGSGSNSPFLLTTISSFYQSPQSGKVFTFSFILCRPTGKVL